MRARGGRVLAALAAILVLAAPAAVRADPAPLTETTTDTPPAATTPTDTTASTTTTVATTATTTAATTTTEAATSAAAAPAAATLAAAPKPQSGCPPVGAAGLLLPHQRPIVLAPGRQLTTAQVAYPADGSIMTAAGLSLDTPCTDARPGGGNAQVRGVSLFGGAVTASTATVSLTGGGASVSGLTVNGRPASLSGGPIRIGNWGYVIAPDPAAVSRSALQVELSAEHDGLPAGTLIFVPYAHIEIAPEPTTTTTPPPAAAAAATTTRATTTTPSTAAITPTTTHEEKVARPKAKKPHQPRHKPGRQPLTVTPPLEAGPYIFPVAGNAAFGDSYGGLRTDVPGGWHHGDDIFAPLGTPVVSVADGTLNRIGWERLGGWRLWVRDRAGDEFYYAHLSGYSPLALSGDRVHRGEVIGFVGNTGDAFTTLPHLHFEIHPRSLLRLQYDGAVNPTSYLLSWPRPGALHPPHPVHPRLPLAADWRHEAAVNFRELLAARGLTQHASARVVAARALPLPLLHAPDPRPTVVTAVAAGDASVVLVGAAAAGGLLVAASLLSLGVWQRRRPSS